MRSGQTLRFQLSTPRPSRMVPFSCSYLNSTRSRDRCQMTAPSAHSEEPRVISHSNGLISSPRLMGPPSARSLALTASERRWTPSESGQLASTRANAEQPRAPPPPTTEGHAARLVDQRQGLGGRRATRELCRSWIVRPSTTAPTRSPLPCLAASTHGVAMAKESVLSGTVHGAAASASHDAWRPRRWADRFEGERDPP